MTDASDNHERSIAFGETALAKIKALRQSAEPRDYEVWYNYATGYNPSLNQAVNDLLARNGNLSAVDVQTIHHTYFAPTRASERIDAVGAKVAGEIDQVMAMIDSAVGSTTSYSESLSDATTQLGETRDREALRAIVESLVHTTREFELQNQTLESRLRTTRREILELQHDLEVVRHASLTDPLTALSNRKCFDDALAKALVTAQTSGRPMSLMMADIDHFKAFNDTFGHLTGDQVLRLVALCIKQTVKGQDTAARYGGEEFAVILPNTGLRNALSVADNIRRAVMSKDLIRRSTGENLGRITLSIGIAAVQQGETVQQLLERADACLYAAKRGGRNRVICDGFTPGDLAPARVA
jgi:diguanylate cyclase